MEGMKNLFKKINPKKWSEKTKYLVASTIFLVIAALVLTWFLEYRYFINDFQRSIGGTGIDADDFNIS